MSCDSHAQGQQAVRVRLARRGLNGRRVMGAHVPVPVRAFRSSATDV